MGKCIEEQEAPKAPGEGVDLVGESEEWAH